MALQKYKKKQKNPTPFTSETPSDRKLTPTGLAPPPLFAILGSNTRSGDNATLKTCTYTYNLFGWCSHEIMKTHDIIFSNRPESSIAKRFLYDCKDVSMAPYGEYWRQMKSIYVLQLLSTKRVQSFRSVRVEETAHMVKRIEECSALNSPMNLSEMFCVAYE